MMKEIKQKLSQGNLSKDDMDKFVEEAKQFVNPELMQDFDRTKERSSYLALAVIATSTINKEISDLALEIYSKWGGIDEKELKHKWEVKK